MNPLEHLEDLTSLCPDVEDIVVLLVAVHPRHHLVEHNVTEDNVPLIEYGRLGLVANILVHERVDPHEVENTVSEFSGVFHAGARRQFRHHSRAHQSVQVGCEDPVERGVVVGHLVHGVYLVEVVGELKQKLKQSNRVSNIDSVLL